jgi:hypothetical protein
MAAQILIGGGANVTLSDITIDATQSNTALCSPFTLVVGVLVQDASATLTNVSVNNQLTLCPGGGVGAGVLVQNDSASATTISVKNSTFVNAAQAFEAQGTNITSTVTGNSFLGTPSSGFNAISIGQGNSTITGNDISDFNYPAAGTHTGTASFGIYICAPTGTASGNVIANTQLAIVVDNGCGPKSVSVTNNTISNAPLIGIVAGAIGGVVQGNRIRSTMTAIRFPAAASNLVQNNVINDACAAYGSDPAAGTSTLLGNTISNVANVSLVNTTQLCP